VSGVEQAFERIEKLPYAPRGRNPRTVERVVARSSIGNM
jgi:hypothetical protein